MAAAVESDQINVQPAAHYDALCSSLDGYLSSAGICLVDYEDLSLDIPEESWNTHEYGFRYSVIEVEGAPVLVIDGELPRIRHIFTALKHIFKSDEIGCSGVYTC